MGKMFINYGVSGQHTYNASSVAYGDWSPVLHSCQLATKAFQCCPRLSGGQKQTGRCLAYSVHLQKDM